jgi:predicted nucleic acid-binding protein
MKLLEEYLKPLVDQGIIHSDVRDDILDIVGNKGGHKNKYYDVIKDINNDISYFNPELTLNEFLEKKVDKTYHSKTLNETFIIRKDVEGEFYFQSLKEPF